MTASFRDRITNELRRTLLCLLHTLLLHRQPIRNNSKMRFRGQAANIREWQRAQQKPLYQFNDSGDTIDRMLADEDHDGYSDKSMYICIESLDPIDI